ncbi:SPFH domain-containing protein [Streptomyces alboflavus]|uniref:SPFH domain-containing protein n=1 Tax=Streptomyces alboflavus TaxID=67267 RepID=UPI0004C2445B|nr:SPFH domain-containing protein [Streptomyces alboflavus]
MSTTAQRPPESGEGSGPAGRSPRLIHSEATMEIPVHLLFRDDPQDMAAASGTAGVPLGSAVVRREAVLPGGTRGAGGPGRAGSGRAGGPGRAEGAGRAGGASRAGQQGQTGPTGPAGRAGQAGRAAVGPVPPAPHVPQPDAGLAERRARVLPGAVGVFGGGVGTAGCALALWWAGVLPEPMVDLVAPAGDLRGGGSAGISVGQWAALAGSGALALFGFGGLARGRVGGAWVLSLFGRYRGSVRRTGLLWVNPLLLRRRVDVRLRHWRSEPMAAVDRSGVALRVVVLVVWRVKDTARATLAVADHQEYLRECVEATTARVLSRLPADAFHDDAPTLRDAEAVGEALTRALAAQTEPVGVEIFSVQPTRIEYAPEVAAAMHRHRIAALDARHRDSLLTSVVDSVEDTVTRLTTRGLVELDDYERRALVKDLTVAFCTGRGGDST